MLVRFPVKHGVQFDGGKDCGDGKEKVGALFECGTTGVAFFKCLQ